MEAVEAADAGGQRDDSMLRGDDRVVQARRELATRGSRRRDAVQAALDKIVPVERTEAIAAEQLRKEREAVAARGGIVMKTAAKVATDEHTWELYVEEQGIAVGEYPSVEESNNYYKTEFPTLLLLLP